MIGSITVGETNEEERGLLVVMKNTSTGARVTGLTTGDVTARIFSKRPGQAATLETSAGTLHEVDATNAPGTYIFRLAAAEVADVRQGFVQVSASGSLSEPVPFAVTPNALLGEALGSDGVKDALTEQGFSTALATALGAAAVTQGAPGSVELSSSTTNPDGSRTQVFTVKDADGATIATVTRTLDARGLTTGLTGE